MAARGPQEEQRLGRTRDIEIIRGLWRFVRPYRGLFAVAMALLPATSACMLAQPYIVKLAIDDYIAAGTTDGLGLWAFAFGLAIVGEFLCLYWQHYFTMLVAQKALADMRVTVFDKVQRMESAYFDRNPVGRLVTRITTDVDVINEMFAAGAFTVIMDLITLAGIVAIMLAINFELALVTLVTLPVMAFFVDFFRRKARQNYRLIRERIARINAYLQEAITGMAVVQLFARERQVAREFDQLNGLHRDANHRSNFYEAALFSIVEAMSHISIALILWFGAHLVLGVPAGLSGTLAAGVGFGTLVAFIEYMNKFFIPIRDFATKYAIMQSAITAGERVFGILNTEPAVTSPERPAAVPPARGEIEFDHVSFSYIEGEPVIRDLSFKVSPGEHLAVVGATGSGKTTITKLIGRFYDVDSGRVLVDGVDVRHWPLDELRRRLGVVLQDVFLFSDTVEENIRLWDGSVSDGAIVEAAEHVHADGFVGRLHGGYAEQVRERGNNFSAGQRQLLSFARALASQPEILMLDEATSNIDSETEALVQDAVSILQRDRTSLVIAHRLSTIEGADRILVLHHGQLRESGTHEKLITQGGVYARLYRLQHEAARDGPAL